MSKLILIICFFTSLLVFSQKSAPKAAYVNVTGFSIKVDSEEELATINWDDIKSIFKDNDPESNVSLEFKVKTKETKDKKLKFKVDYSFKSVGKAKAIDTLIVRMKKGINYINKITKKSNHEN
ncbi:hypothetical protein [Polaribacter sargassicola]|uniref:hypothetical protein n=1 Tax=Polaribacter sargassicola TaxID=2836891 RepID=UPI001F16DAC4|nr:hypothetical protein [Polaribacter sp. DS7-9]MCG1036091.1 hypothetical protein [Polaribacter sp. DS7-9]